MPRMDGKGPFGKGPLTGRGLGNCGIPETESSGIYLAAGLVFGVVVFCAAAIISHVRKVIKEVKWLNYVL